MEEKEKKGLLDRIGSHIRGIQITLLIFAGLFTLYSLFGFFALPPILKSVLTKQIQEKTGRQASIGKISTNPYWLTADIRDLVVKDRDGTPFLSFDELFMDLQAISVFKPGPVLKEVRLVRPYLKVVRNPDLTYNVLDLPAFKKPQAKKKPTYYSVNNIQIYGGKVDFHDVPKKSLHSLTDIDMSVPFVSDFSYYVDTFVLPSFSARLDGRSVSLKGRTKPFAASRETQFNIDIKDLDLTKYIAYLPEDYRLNIKGGLLSAKGKLSFIEYRAGAGKDKPSLKLSGLFTLSDFRLDGQDGSKLADVPSVKVALREAEAFSEQAAIDSIEVDNPDIAVSRDKAGRLNLSGVLPPKKGQPAAERPKGGPEEKGKLTVRVASAKLSGGSLHFTDEKNSQPFKTTLSPVNLEAEDLVYDLRQAENPESEFTLSATSEAGEVVDARGKVSLRPVKADGYLSVQDVPVGRYQPYLADSFNFTTKGTLAVSSDFGYSAAGLLLSDLNIDLRSLALRKTGDSRDFITVPSLLITRTEVDTGKRRLTVGSVDTKGGRVVAARDEKGRVNLAGLVKQQPAGKQGATAAGLKKQAWKILVKNLSLSSYMADVSDLAAESPVQVRFEKIRLSMRNFSPEQGGRSPVSFSFVQKGGGQASASGTFGISPVAASLKLYVKDIDVIPFQPYFTRDVNIDVISGSVSANGSLDVSYSKEKGLGYSYSGDASVDEFDSADKDKGEDFLNWKTLYFGGVSASSGPFSLDIKQVALADFYSKLVIYPDGTLNVQNIISKPAAKQQAGQAQAPQAPQPPPGGAARTVAQANQPGAVKVERVTLQGGHINFTDNHIKPNYAADLTEIGGRISGLSSDEKAAADVDLRGLINKYAPVEITGKMNPLRKDLYVDLALNMSGMDLSQFTPYSRKYVGYTIEKGKLSMNLKYLIVRKALNSQNSVLFDQLTLGQSTPSPQAVKLPVKLAISLLKDRNGRINLDFPVTGDLGNPKFNFGDVILRVVLNTLRKIVTSPFALLGRIFGGGEELGYVEFDYGSDKLNAPAEKKVQALNKALYNRPHLQLDVAGYVDPRQDRTALRKYLFTRKIKEARYEDMPKDKRPADPDDVQIKPDEYGKYLKKAYKAAKFPKPKNVFGLEKSLPVPEMEKLLLTNTVVTDADLAQLARKRAAAVQNALLKPGNVDPKRVFLTNPGTLAPPEKKKLTEARVQFGLK